MRNLFFLVIGIASFVNISLADDSYLIRRAYIDILGIVPTIPEIEWYCVYNKNGYELAVKWLIDNSILKLTKDQAKTKFLSDVYKKQDKRKLSKEELDKILIYVSGLKDKPVTPENVNLACIKIIKDALNPELEIGPMDYMSNILMCRSLKINEENELNKILKEALKTNNELDSWIIVLNNILNLEDVKSK